MTTVIAQPYSTAGNSGRKLVRLSNGWLVAAVKELQQEIRFYKSADNGTTWEQICTVSQGAANSIGDFALTSRGTQITVLVARTGSGFGSGDRTVAFDTFDAVTVTNTRRTGITNNLIDKNQNAIGAVSLAIDPQNGHLHATWTSTNSTFPNSFNIRYAKSTDGGVTWSSPLQVTNFNVTNTHNSEPTIAVRKDGAPIIVYVEMASATSKAIGRKVFEGGTWGYGYVNKSEVGTPANPSVVVDKNGVIHVVWEGRESANGAPHAIYRRSPDGGVTWQESVIRLPLGNNLTVNSITVDCTGRVVICGGNLGTIYSYVSNDNGVTWTATPAWSISSVQDPSTLFDPTFSGSFGNVVPAIYKASGSVQYVGTYNTNREPAVTVTSPVNNLTLYENDTFNIAGTSLDTDNGNTVTIRYQINALTTRAIKAFLSDGSTLESFSKTLTFKGGNLYDGTTLIAENLSDGVAHTLKVWATDDQGGTSAIREIPFYVVPNRAPLLTVNAPVISGLINSDKFTINGTFEDSDRNNTIVSYRLNGGSSVQVAEGVNGPFEFELSFGQLVIGANEIVIEAVDSYGAKVSKTVKLNKAAVETPLLKSTARYKINPPTGSARGVLLWIQRDENLVIDVAISMTMQGEVESFVPLTVSNSAPLDQNSPIIEDEFYHEADGTKDNIILQIDMERASLEVSDKIYLISGVLD